MSGKPFFMDTNLLSLDNHPISLDKYLLTTQHNLTKLRSCLVLCSKVLPEQALFMIGQEREKDSNCLHMGVIFRFGGLLSSVSVVMTLCFINIYLCTQKLGGLDIQLCIYYAFHCIIWLCGIILFSLVDFVYYNNPQRIFFIYFNIWPIQVQLNNHRKRKLKLWISTAAAF